MVFLLKNWNLASSWLPLWGSCREATERALSQRERQAHTASPTNNNFFHPRRNTTIVNCQLSIINSLNEYCVNFS